jgi:hypothetical protein
MCVFTISDDELKNINSNFKTHREWRMLWSNINKQILQLNEWIIGKFR